MTDVGAFERKSWEERNGQPICDSDRNITAGICLVYCTADSIDDVLIGLEAGITTNELKTLLRVSRTDVGEDGDKLHAVVSFASNKSAVVVVDSSVVVCHEIVRDRGDVIPDVVDLLDPLVQGGLGVVFRRPESFTVKRVGASTEVLFLSLVDNWDTILENGEGNSILGENHVRLGRWEARFIVVLHE